MPNRRRVRIELGNNIPSSCVSATTTNAPSSPSNPDLQPPPPRHALRPFVVRGVKDAPLTRTKSSKVSTIAATFSAAGAANAAGAGDRVYVAREVVLHSDEGDGVEADGAGGRETGADPDVSITYLMHTRSHFSHRKDLLLSSTMTIMLGSKDAARVSASQPHCCAPFGRV